MFDILTTKSALKKALKKGLITVNDVVASSATFISGGETIVFTKPVVKTPKKIFNQELHIVFEDDFLAIIRKPPGLLVNGNSFKTVANALEQNLKPSTQKDATKPQPVHRLDYATTGLLLIGKTAQSIIALNLLFRHKTIQKQYYAISMGKMTQQKGTINSLVDDKVSISHYKVLASVDSTRFTQLNLVDLSPETGRRHQLRKHLASLGNPILGDKDYNSEDLTLYKKGMYLHAYSLEFEHPFTKEKLFIKDDFPKRFKKIFRG